MRAAERYYSHRQCLLKRTPHSCRTRAISCHCEQRIPQPLLRQPDKVTFTSSVDFTSTTLVSGHPHYFNQLSCGLDVVSMAGEWLTATANTNMFTYEIAPVFILMEHVVLKKMRETIGFMDGDSILAPGN